ncbi:four helix bundle protein [Echinicola shivajiensis]|uniref:four helix bundle protein n=1 Tax=Echinicola shivajiensis TaxID=1035916 RepID=UPI001BFC7BD1|nr:four helix bundle protein [Echinicola shivajiensis]
MKNNLIQRTKEYAVKTWFFCSKLPKSREYNAYVNQLIRCSSSVGANYRASQRAKSTADFLNKLKIVEEEADESLYFLEILKEIKPDLSKDIEVLHQEGNEILSIMVASIKKVKLNNSK